MFRRRSGIEIKSPDQLAVMRQAGLVVARALHAIEEAATPGTTTAELDAIAREVLRDHRATSSFLGYRAHGAVPYPGVICASVNEEVVHGIPGSRVLREGDLLSVDFGAIVDGWNGDAAVTILVGQVAPEAAELSRITEAALWAGLDQARVGAHLTDISHAVESTIVAAEQEAGREFGIVEDYGGHGIGSRMHMEPHILNYGAPGRGPVLRPGMALAIEPMVTLGNPAVMVQDDAWTVVTLDGSLASHWEHTVAVTEEGPWVLTVLEDPVR
ncbi:MAG: type I methionyl aminopeptidase [Actinomycetales bacterium]|nr:type I methionyl aminopeptidase [Actinomycetales bacterium]